MNEPLSNASRREFLRQSSAAKSHFGLYGAPITIFENIEVGGKPLEVIKADLSDLIISAHAEMVIEAELDLTNPVSEGPYHETYGEPQPSRCGGSARPGATRAAEVAGAADPQAVVSGA